MPRDNGKQQRKIERWETVELLHSDSVQLDRATISIVIEVRRPIFEGDIEGFPRMSCTLRRTDKDGRERDLRLLCYDGNVEEPQAMCSLLDGISTFAEFTDRYKEIAAEHRRVHDRPKGKPRGGDRRATGGVGGGLGQWSAPGKTARKRKKRQEKQPGGE